MNKDPQTILRDVFGYREFRPMQKEIIQAVMQGQDAFVLMPTGGGKSLCFQIPAISMPGTCIVVSPLISLMKDQVRALKLSGVKADYLNSSQTIDEQDEVDDKLRRGALDLLYISPEKLVSQSMLFSLSKLKINLFAIDEAHCISSWGHDFRPEYSQLAVIRQYFRGVPVIALTATADKLTRKDILVKLRLDNPKRFTASFDRPNLSLQVLPAQNRMKFIQNYVKGRKKDSGIIYCLSRKSTEKVAEKLRKKGIVAESYHAGLSSQERNTIQERFVMGETPVICATVAFGMGIDKSDVRYVIHYNLPKNIEGYYQEIGRAGRDGQPADTILFYSLADVITLRGLIENSQNNRTQLSKLERMQQYSDALMCRRKILLSYFGEKLEQDCNNCDVCNDPPELFDGTELVQKALSAIYRTNQEVAPGMLIDILRGSGKQEVLQRGYHQIKTFGAGKDIAPPQWQEYIHQMLHHGLVEVAYDKNHSLQMTEHGKHILLGKKQIKLVKLTDATQKAQERLSQSKGKQIKHLELFEKLREFRKDIAQTKNVAPYMVASDATLREIATKLPTTRNDMLEVSGIGEQKYDMYGEDFVRVVIEYMKAKDKAGEKFRGATLFITYDYYTKGWTPEQIAKERGLGVGTIYGHLAKLYEMGYDINIEKFVKQDELQKVIDMLDLRGVPHKLSELHSFFDGTLSYETLKFSLAHYNLVNNT